MIRLRLSFPLLENVPPDVCAYVQLFADVVANEATKDTDLTI